MKKMSARGQKWLKCFHLFFVALWVGAAVCLNLKQFTINPTDGMELYGITATMKFVDDFVIIPGAVGALLTGLIYSIWTNWGFFKHRWVIVKWVITLYGVLFGTFALGPWLNALSPMAREMGMAALENPTFQHNRVMLMVLGTFQAITVIFALFVSVLKPWKKAKGSGS